MDVSTDGFAKLLLKSFSLLLCTSFPQLLQGSRKPPREGGLSSARQGPASIRECSHWSSSGRARAPGCSRAGRWAAWVALASSEFAASCRRGVRGSELAAAWRGSLGGAAGSARGGCSGRHLAGKTDPVGGWGSRTSEGPLKVKAQSPIA